MRNPPRLELKYHQRSRIEIFLDESESRFSPKLILFIRHSQIARVRPWVPEKYGSGSILNHFLGFYWSRKNRKFWNWNFIYKKIFTNWSQLIKWSEFLRGNWSRAPYIFLFDFPNFCISSMGFQFVSDVWRHSGLYSWCWTFHRFLKKTLKPEVVILNRKW